jgi:hypothetical protein
VGEYRLSAISRKTPMMTGGQSPVQSTSSTLSAANDPKYPKYPRAAQLNSKSCHDTSLPTLHLFPKIKVLRQPVEAANHRASDLMEQVTATDLRAKQH